MDNITVGSTVITQTKGAAEEIDRVLNGRGTSISIIE